MSILAKSMLWFCALLLSVALVRAESQDIAIAIVYDTSGSMGTGVKGKDSGGEPKYVIGNRALGAIVTKLEKFAASSRGKVQVGLFIFRDKGSQEVVKIGPFNAAGLRAWIAGFNKPTGGTPLGTAIGDAAKALAEMNVGSRHVLVITDGENTAGPAPEALMPGLLASSAKKGAPLQFHFVAFDVDARVFAGVKKLGATLVSAANEEQLNFKISTILEEKILLEKE